MHRIPVGQTIARSYRFVFANYLTLLGIAWLPLTVMVLASVVYLQLATQVIVTGASHDPAAGLRNFPATILLYILILGLMVVVAMGMVREALGIRQGPRFFYFRFGGDEWRAAGAIFFLLILFGVATFLAAIIGGIVAAIVVGIHAASADSQSLTNPQALLEVFGVVGIVLSIVGILFFYFAVRYGFLLFPAAAVEHNFGIGRSRDLTKGNFWRALAVIFLTNLPILVINFLFVWITFGPAYAAMLSHFGDPKALAYQAEEMQKLLRAQWQYMPYFWIAGLIASPITYGLLFVPAAFSYRALTAEESATTATAT
jgi:hypothetical protein